MRSAIFRMEKSSRLTMTFNSLKEMPLRIAIAKKRTVVASFDVIVSDGVKQACSLSPEGNVLFYGLLGWHLIANGHLT